MISIITVVRNGVASIEETILSVINQNYFEIEYIIIDGVSTDGTLSVIEKYVDKISTFVSEPDNGIYDAMNKGIKLAKGDWIYFLGADDVLYSKNTLFNIFIDKSHDNVEVIYGDVMMKQSQILYDGKFDYEKMSNRSICHQAIFYRKEVFDKYGFFNTRYITAADYVFNLKSFCSDYEKWLYVDEVVAVFNQEGISKSRDENSKADNFAIRYDSFRTHVSKYVLSRIFWSSYFRYFLKHNLKTSWKYLTLVKSDIGFVRLFLNFPVIIWRKVISNKV